MTDISRKRKYPFADSTQAFAGICFVVMGVAMLWGLPAELMAFGMLMYLDIRVDDIVYALWRDQ